MPVNLLCWGILDKGLPHIQRHPDTVIVIDHLGLLQPARPPVPPDVWADLPTLLALAPYANVRVKKMFHMCWASSDGSSKLIPIDEQPNHQIVHLFRLGKAQRPTR